MSTSHKADARVPVQRKADNKTSAGGRLSPEVAAVVEDSLAGEGQPKSDAVLLACRDERFEQSVANPARNSRSRIFQFDQHITTGFPAYNVKLAPTRHRFEGVGNQVKEYALHTGAYERQRYRPRHFEQDLNVMVLRGCRCGVRGRSDDLADVTNLGR